jgi:hypothetical protein
MASELRHELQEHLSSCPGCRAIESSLRAFHTDFAATPEPEHALVARVTKHAFFPARIIRLSHYRPRPQSTAGQTYVGVLAAMTGPAGVRPGFETVASFASEPDHILLRVRQDAEHRRVKVYYHADDPGKRDGAIVSIPSLPAEIVLDDHGQMEFGIPEAKTSREWAALDAIVTLPVGVLQVEPPPAGETLSTILAIHGVDDYRVVLQNSGGAFMVSVQPIGDAIPVRRVVAKDGSGTTVIADLSDGRATFSVTPAGDRFVLRFYL